ncbi:MAG: aminotransferase class I/II-fold pyridoxal phosphate-dependent enzyme, partial [Mariprofundaceae bacterium]|nr:aminotransferase class I/II-fold pyridoxal phosphate-dependent enzyme [Mariprofundaceae bacterium]
MKHAQPRLDRLGAYPFERLKSLFADVRPNHDLPHIDAGVGEPRLPLPGFVREILDAHLGGFSRYPPSRGMPVLREAISEWLMRRYGLSFVNPESQVLTANGTREALFAVAHALVNPETFHPKPFVLMPNPMYQIYLGAAVTAGAEPHFMPCTQDNGFAPDTDAVTETV